jgi:hypothetical protein
MFLALSGKRADLPAIARSSPGEHIKNQAGLIGVFFSGLPWI